ncbi:MAG: type II toxin-antitoxin system VapC family toxin [Nanoarchaeota archaeon]
MVFLDTSFVIDYLRGRENARKVYQNFKISGESLNISAIVITELITGAYVSKKTEEEISKVKNFLAETSIFDFTEDDAFEAGKIEAQLMKKGDSIEPEDIMIASTALLNEETLVTRNKKHFEKIPNLKIVSY